MLRRRHYGWHGYGPGFHPCHRGRHWHGHGHGPRGAWGPRGGFGRTTWWLYPLFQRLDTTPGQEKVIRREAEEFRTAMLDMRGEMVGSRADVAKALRGESLDETALGELFARHDDHIRSMRERAVSALARIHDALDEHQRARLAEIIESGPRGFYRGGPYRGEYRNEA